MSSTPENRRRIVVIGGGISGLAAAHKIGELSEQLDLNRRPEVVLLESSDRVGGVIRSRKEHGCLIECGPDSFITQKPWAVNLCQRIGLTDRIVQTNEDCRRTFVALGGKLHPVPEGFIMLAPTQWWPFVTSSLFSPVGKLRMAMDLILPKRTSRADESLSDFVLRRLGREALERIAQPMVGGIYTADPDLLSLQATMPRFLELEDHYGSIIKGMLAEQLKRSATPQKRPAESGARYSIFVSLDDGLQVLVDKLVSKLPATAVRCGVSATKVVPATDQGRWEVILSGGGSLAADGLVLAMPSYAAAALLSELDDQLSSDLGSIPYASSSVLNLIYDRSDIRHKLDGFGFVVPATEPQSMIACTFSSVKYPGRAPDGKVLIRVFLGGALKPEINDLPEVELLKITRADLAQLLAVSAEPQYSCLSSWPRSMPQYHVGHLSLVERIESRLAAMPVLALAGNAFRGVGIPDSIHSGELAAEGIMKQLV